MTQAWHNCFCIMAFYKFAKHGWLFQMLALAIFITWLNSNSTGMLFHPNIRRFMGKHTYGRLWTISCLWTQILSPKDVGSPCDKFKPSDNRLPICWLLTLYPQDFMGCRLKADDLNINQHNSAEGFLCICHAAAERAQRLQAAGSEGINFGGYGVIIEGSFQGFLVSGIFWDAGLRDHKTRELSSGDGTGQPQNNPLALSLSASWITPGPPVKNTYST